MTKENLVSRYKDDTDGNVSIMFAVSFLATLSVMGAVFDFSLMSKSKQHAQYLADAAALAALKYDGTIEEKEAVFSEHVNTLAKISGGGEIPSTSFVDVEINQTETSLTLNANLNVPHELMILHHLEGFETLSLSTQAEMGIENVEVALVLDISSSMNGARINEAKKSTTFFVDQVLGDAVFGERVSMSLIPFGGTVRLPVEMSNLLDTPLDDIGEFSENWIGGEWNQCLELDASDTENGIKPDGSYRVTPDYWSWTMNNPWCPKSGSELVPLTNDREVLINRIDTLSLSDGTGSDHGMAWGFETLNHDWKNKFPGGVKDTPAENKSSTKKVMVFMSDGGITSQHYVRDKYMTGTPPFNSRRKIRVSFRDSLDAFYGACERAKSNDIEVYTIGYNLKKTAHKNYLTNCATSESHYIDASSGDLEQVFSGLAASISPLRVSN